MVTRTVGLVRVTADRYHDVEDDRPTKDRPDAEATSSISVVERSQSLPGLIRPSTHRYHG